MRWWFLLWRGFSTPLEWGFLLLLGQARFCFLCTFESKFGLSWGQPHTPLREPHAGPLRISRANEKGPPLPPTVLAYRSIRVSLRHRACEVGPESYGDQRSFGLARVLSS